MNDRYLKTPALAYHHACKLEDAFPEGEAIIATSAEYSYAYAANVLGERFPLGEKAIVTSARFAFSYAEAIIRGAFQDGEAIIATSDYFSLHYAMLTKSPFPLGEPVISTSPEYSFKYARDVLKGAFPLGENAIKKIPDMYVEYKIFLVNNAVKYTIDAKTNNLGNIWKSINLNKINGLTQQQEAKLPKIIKMALDKTNYPAKSCLWQVDRYGEPYLAIKF